MAVEGYFPEYSSHNNRGYFRLNANKSMNPFTWGPPINWSGHVCNTPVKFIQISADGSSISDFDFTGFPEKYNEAKGYIVEAIDEAMRIMD